MFANRRIPHLLLAAALAMPALSQAQSFSANYDLTHPILGTTDADLVPGRMLGIGNVRFGAAFPALAGAGAGLSLEAGEAWFGRLTLGRSLEVNQVTLAGGYHFGDGQSVYLQLTRAGPQERLGLSVRYDWPRYFLRLGFDPRANEGTFDRLRFSAGVRF